MTYDEQVAALEAMVDECQLCNVVDALAQVCREKASHLAVTWNSPDEAMEWTHAAEKLDTLAASTDYPWLIV